MSKKFKLPKEFTEKWVKALRSGDYKQCTGKMYKREHGYCCLGVAMSINGVPDSKMDNKGVPVNKTNGVFMTKTKSIPRELYGTAGNNELLHEFTKMNDTNKNTFDEIADWIEDNIEKY